MTNEFRKFLKDNNIEFHPQKGVYGGDPERSNLIEIKTPEQKKMIDGWLEKNSPQNENILIQDGNVIRYNPRNYEAYGVDLGKFEGELSRPDTTSDYYSEIAGNKYAFPLYDESVERAIDNTTFMSYYNN
jgi:hypothetical protein